MITLEHIYAKINDVSLFCEEMFQCHHFQEGEGKWLSLDSELIMRNGEVIGTQAPTGHSVLVDARFELPYGELSILLFSTLKTPCTSRHKYHSTICCC
jgi:hypothetical protein